MTSDPERNLEFFYVTLWIGALLLAGNGALELCPAEFDKLVTQFLAAYRPSAKA